MTNHGKNETADAAAKVPLLEASGGAAAVAIVGGATAAQTLANVVVSLLGTGILGLPYAFRIAGWLGGSVCFALSAAVIYVCMLLLMQCRKKLEEENDGGDAAVQHETYGDVAFAAFGAPGRFLAELSIFISYAGGLVSYLVFIGQNLSSVFPSLSPATVIFFILLPLEAALSFIRSLAVLAPFSLFANACNALALVIVLLYDIFSIRSSDVPRGNRSAFTGFGGALTASGMALFAMDGLGMTLSLESSMAERRRFPVVLVQAFLGVVLFSVCFGAFGYIAFGDDTRDIITLNLPNNLPAAIVVVGLCIAIAFSFPLFMHPVNEIVEAKLQSSMLFAKLCNNVPCGSYLGLQSTRIVMLIALAVVGTTVPGFGVLLSFIGGTACAFISFIFPATFHLKLMGRSLNLWRRLSDCAIIATGLVFAVYSTYVTVTGSYIWGASISST